MPYTVTKEVTPKTSGFWAKVLPVPILLLAVPVALIGLLSMLVLLVVDGVVSLFRKKDHQKGEELYHKELSLVQHPAVSITVTEDEEDADLTEWNEAWTALAYDDETYLYRAKTTPIIPLLHNRIVGFYCLETPGGVILQVAAGKPHPEQLSTELVYLHYESLVVTPLADIGCAHLYNDPDAPQVIKGFNDREEVVLTVHAQ